MGLLITLFLNTLAVYVTSSIIPGVRLKDLMTAVVVAVVLGIVNTFIRPFIIVLTLPINVVTLGLFTFVIMGALTLFVSYLVPGFEVDGFWWAVLFSAVLAIVNSFLLSLVRPVYF